MSCIVLATSSAPFEQRVRSALEGGLNGVLQVLPRGAVPADPAHLLAHVTGSQTPEVVVLGPGLDPEGTLALAALFDEHCPGISVVLVTEPDADTWLAAMRAGVRDLLAPEADVAEIRIVLERAVQAAASHRRAVGAVVDDSGSTGRIITVASAKGGTGKTTVSTNLAVGLARLHPHSTVLVDLDVQFGDVASALQITPEYCLTDAVTGPSSQDAMVLKTFLDLHPSGLYTLCAPDTPAGADNVTAEQVTRLLDLLAASFPYVVVDTAPGLGEHALAALERATDIVQVCGMDVPSVRGLRKELEVLAELGIAPLTCSVVLNFADRHGGLTVPDVEAAIGRTVDIVLPPSKAVPLSTNHGVPLLQNDQRNPVTKQLNRLVSRYVDPSAAATGVDVVAPSPVAPAPTAPLVDPAAQAARDIGSGKPPKSVGRSRSQPEHARASRRWGRRRALTP